MPWGDEIEILQGGGGYVPLDTNTKRRPFFVEVMAPDIYIRGEGETLEAAEKVAWQKYQNRQTCAEHEYETRGYTNGAAFCIHCKGFFGNVYTAEELGVRCSVCNIFSNYTRLPDDSHMCQPCYETMLEANAIKTITAMAKGEPVTKEEERLLSSYKLVLVYSKNQ